MDAQHDFGARDGHRPALLPFTASWTTATAYQGELSVRLMSRYCPLPRFSSTRPTAGLLVARPCRDEKVSAVSTDRVAYGSSTWGGPSPQAPVRPRPVLLRPDRVEEGWGFRADTVVLTLPARADAASRSHLHTRRCKQAIIWRVNPVFPH
ncbi:hypothetical protein [Streptomyces sp. YIM S03343]